MAAVVHHDGAGTTAAGLQAGKLAVICPTLGDQPFWGRVMFDRGLGPRPIPLRQLSPTRLAAEINAATEDRGMARRAAALGARIQAEDGVGNTVALLDHYLQHDRTQLALRR